MASLTASTKCMVLLVLSRVSVAKSKRSILMGVAPALLVGNLKNVLIAWFFIPARWTISKLNLDKQSRHGASRPELSNRFKIQMRQLAAVLSRL